MGRVEYGIWSDLAGGLLDAGMSERHANRERIVLIKDEGEEADDLEVVPLCEFHPGERRSHCEECADEWEDDE